MSRLSLINRHKQQRAYRVRSRINGTATRPRLSAHISNLHVSAQLIDDASGNTLVYVTTTGRKMGSNLSERATWVGTEIAKKAKAAKISEVVFDRGAKLYHGRVKALAEAAREGGLKF